MIPCYNQAHFLPVAIESALDQTRRPDEIVVIDDGSTDNTYAVATRYAGVLYFRQQNAGLSGARNTGLRVSTGEYIAFLDADDKLMPDAIEQGLRSLHKNPKAAFAFGRYRLTRLDQRTSDVPLHQPLTDDPYESLLRENSVGMIGAVLFRRRALLHVDGFTRHSPVEDYDLYLRLAREFPIASHPDVVAEYMLHTSNMAGSNAAQLKAVMSVLRSQLPYVIARRRLRHARRDGKRLWQLCYGGPLVNEATTYLRSHQWTAMLRSLVTLLLNFPRGALMFMRRQSFSAPADEAEVARTTG